MQSSTPSRTAEFMALFRALETIQPARQRLFADPLAIGFLSPRLRAVVWLARVPGLGRLVRDLIDRRWPGARTSGVARTRLIDEAMTASLGAGARQIVLLGAGFDARAYRIPGIERARVYEVDHPATLAVKTERLAKLLGRVPAHVRFVAVDFNRQDLDTALAGAGFEARTRSFIVWEGVTNYLTDDAVDATLRWAASAAAPQSRIVFTYVHRGLLDGSARFTALGGVAATLRNAAEPWTFGMNPEELPHYLASRGLVLLEDVGAADYRARYMGAAARAMHGYEFYRAVLAEVGGGAAGPSGRAPVGAAAS